MAMLRTAGSQLYWRKTGGQDFTPTEGKVLDLGEVHHIHSNKVTIVDQKSNKWIDTLPAGTIDNTTWVPNHLWSPRLDGKDPHAYGEINFPKSLFNDWDLDREAYVVVSGSVASNRPFDENAKFEVVINSDKFFSAAATLLTFRVANDGLYAKAWTALVIGHVVKAIDRLLTFTVRCSLQERANAGDSIAFSVTCSAVLGGGLVDWYLPKTITEYREVVEDDVDEASWVVLE